MTGLDNWLKQATRCLSRDSTAQVRNEIREHYESARDAAMVGGMKAEEADRMALAALGDAKAANRQYRRVLLTSPEASMLRDSNWEAKVVCSRGWVKYLLLALPVALFLAAATLMWEGAVAMARDTLLMAIAMSPLVAALVLPVYTPARGRIFRVAKWVVFTSAVVLMFGPIAIRWSWLLVSCFWPLIWTEWMRASIRRKLPVERWPKQLYL